MSKGLRCFQEDLRGKSYTTVEEGLRVVEVACIAGSVDKCRELDRRFRPLRRRDRGERQRRARLAAAMRVEARAAVPPVELYRHGGLYYVLDGHRRVAAALEAGAVYLDALVTDVVLLGDEAAVRAAVGRKRFEAETGLVNLRLAGEAGYADLLRRIEGTAPGTEHGGSDLKELARRWYSGEFLPACRRIRGSGLLELFPGRREGDLFVLVLRFHRDFDSGFPRGADFERVLDRFVASSRRRRRLGGRLEHLGRFMRLGRLAGLLRPRRRGPPGAPGSAFPGSAGP